jgi:lysophospholipid acyltransferase (LPLAT)-like uncharacterized protein
VKKLRIRDIFLKFPALDKARVLGLAKIFKYGISCYDLSYRNISVVPDESRPYVPGGNASGYVKTYKPAIYAYFHGQMYLLLGLAPRSQMNLLVSNSRDGEMIARAAEGMGFRVTRGSKTEGGTRGARNLLGKAAEEGASMVFAVDGPRGPKEKVKPEVIRLASLSQLPIIPIVGEARTRDLMKSWDQYNCPYIHSPIVSIYGKPLFIPANLDQAQTESLRLELETYMVQLKAKAACFF